MNTPLPHVLFVVPSFAGGGAERVLLTLFKGLDVSQFTKSLVVLDGQGPLKIMLGDDADTIDLHQPRLRHAILPLLQHIRRVKPDIVFSTLGYVNIALLLARPLLPKGTKLVLREANLPSLALAGIRNTWALRKAYNWLYPKADRLICTSEKMAHEMQVDFKVPEKRIINLPNPIDVAQLRQCAKPIHRHPGNGVRLVAAGRMTYQKGFDGLLNIMTEVQPSTHLTLLGKGPDFEKLQDQAKDLGLAAQVTFTGFCENPWGYYAGADALVMPSRWEGLPNAALEALACGTPVIATPQSGGIEEIATHAPDGAVTVASISDGFVDAMKNADLVYGVTRGASNIKPSLLPEIYEMSRVADQFQRICMDVLN